MEEIASVEALVSFSTCWIKFLHEYIVFVWFPYQFSLRGWEQISKWKLGGKKNLTWNKKKKSSLQH